VENSLKPDNTAILTQLIGWFESSEEASQHGRKESEQARDYYDGKQLTEAERKVLRRRKQPEVVINRIKRKIDFLRGLERQSRTDPIAYPRTAVHEDEAEAATDALRYVSQDQLFDMKRSQVWDNMLVEGMGGVEVGVTRGRDGIDVKLTRLPWDRCFSDPHSSEPDYSDARYLGYVTWMDVSEAKARFKGKEALIESTMNHPVSSNADTYDDKPRWALWGDTKRKRIRIVTMCYRVAGVWHGCVMTLSGFLQEPAPSPFLDEDGQPECPIVFQSAYVDRDNDRYGVVRDMISPQDEVNKRRSKALHLLTMRQVRISQGAATTADGKSDPGAIRDELAKPDGILIGEHQEVEILPNNDQVAGHFQLMQEAKGEIDMLGPNATLQGKSGQDQSGRAIMALQQGGMVELSPLLDQLHQFNIRVFRQVWNRIRQYWTEERWVRVTDDEKGVRFVGLNTTQGALAARKVQAALAEGKIDRQTAAQYMQQIQMDPSMQQPANTVAELDVDIEIDEVNETPTVQMEQFEQLTKLAATGLVPIPPDVIIQASSLRDKNKLLEMLKSSQEQQGQTAQMAQMIQLEGAKAQIEETKSKALKNVAQAHAVGAPKDIPAEDPHVKAAQEAVRLMLEARAQETDEFRAETERMTATQPMQPPQ
jgi:hypothetical protein